MQNKILMGHLFALVTILLWGTTFISTKVLLRSFTPIEILFFRFIMGLIVLFLIYPYRLKVTDKKQEWIFAGAGLSGITLYYLFENIALVYAPASNVGVITATAPFFTASSVSKTFTAVVLYPFGNPITVQIGNLSPTYSLALFTKDAGIHADATS